MNKKTTIFAVVICVFGFFALVAMENQGQKFGTVDVGKIAEDSKLGKRKKTDFDGLRTKMAAVLQFIQANRTVTTEQMTQLRNLSLVEKPTADQTKELEAIKAAISKTKEEYDTLIRKPQLTEVETKRLQTLGDMIQQAGDRFQQMDKDFGQQMSSLAQESQAEVLSKAREAVKKLGKRDGFSVIFEDSAAPYAANDTTADVLKIMDSDNP